MKKASAIYKGNQAVFVKHYEKAAAAAAAVAAALPLVFPYTILWILS